MLKFNLSNLCAKTIMNNIKIYHNNSEVNNTLNNNSFFRLFVGNSEIYSNIFTTTTNLLPYFLMIKYMWYHSVELYIYVHDESINKFMDGNFELNVQFENIFFNNYINEEIGYNELIQSNKSDNEFFINSNSRKFIQLKDDHCNIFCVLNGMGGNMRSFNTEFICDLFNFEPYAINNKQGYLINTLKYIELNEDCVNKWIDLIIDNNVLLNTYSLNELKLCYKNHIYSTLHNTIEENKINLLTEKIIHDTNKFVLIQFKLNNSQLIKKNNVYKLPHKFLMAHNRYHLYNLSFNTNINNNEHVTLILKERCNNIPELSYIVKYDDSKTWNCYYDIKKLYQDPSHLYELFINIPINIINNVDFDLEFQMIIDNKLN
jgi:hypothetical protein